MGDIGEALTADDIWATEYPNSNAPSCCHDPRKLHGDEASSSEAKFHHPRLVQRDGKTLVSMKSHHGRRSRYCAGLNETFQTMAGWKVGRVPAFFLAYILAFLFFGLLNFAQNGTSDDFVGVNHTFLSSMAFVAFTMTTVGYGDQRPANEGGTIVPVISVLFAILMSCFFASLITLRLQAGQKLSNTLLFSNRATISSQPHDASQGLCTQDPPLRLFECRMINLRQGLPWVECRICIYYVAFRSHHRPIYLNLPLRNPDVPVFMDLPWYIVHEISPDSPLYNLRLEDLVAERGEIVVEIEGFDPLTSTGIKKRFSYVAAELFVEHQFYDVLSLDSDGKFEADLTHFHRTKPMQVGNATLDTTTLGDLGS